MVQKQAMPEEVKDKILPVKKTNQIILTKKITPEMLEEKKQAPVIVKFIGILWYILTGVTFILGICLFFVSGALGSFMAPDFLMGVWFYIFPILFILLAVLFLFVARGLFKLQKWARILAVIFAGLGIISSVYSLIRLETIVGNIIGLIISGDILYVLMINKKSRQAFN